MALSGFLGPSGTGLENLGLGTVGTGGATTRTVQAKANIRGTSTQTCQAKARIVLPPATLQTAQAKANIRATRTQIAQAKAHISTLTTAQSRCELDFNVLSTFQLRCPVSYNVGDRVVSTRSVQAKASITRELQTRLAVRFEVDYQMPSGYVHRPTQRTEFRTMRTCVAKARIKAP